MSLSPCACSVHTHCTFCDGKDTPQAMAEAGRKQNDRPLYLVTVTAGDWAEEGTEALAQLQELRKSGARSYTVSLCGARLRQRKNFGSPCLRRLFPPTTM